MENNWLNLRNLLEKILTDRDSIPLEVQKIFNELVEERASGFKNLEKRINLDKLIYNYKTERRNPKDFRNYQNLRELFKNLRNGNINSREVLKNQINFKSDLGEVRKRNPDFKSEQQISVTPDADKFSYLSQKVINFLEIIHFHYLKLNTK